MESRIKKFNEIGIKNVDIVGGKNASLGEMFNQLTSKGVRIPDGFATTSYAFWEFLKENEIQKPLEKLLTKLDRKKYSNLAEIGKQARELILKSKFSEVFSKEIIAEHLWGDHSDLLDNFDFIYVHINNLRKKMTLVGAKYIQTTYGSGYKFTDI